MSERLNNLSRSRSQSEAGSQLKCSFSGFYFALEGIQDMLCTSFKTEHFI